MGVFLDQMLYLIGHIISEVFEYKGKFYKN